MASPYHHTGRSPSALAAIFCAPLFVPASALAQCALCKQALLNSSEGPRLAGSVNAAILLMLGAWAAVVGSIAWLVFNACRKRATLEVTTGRQPAPARAGHLATVPLCDYISLTKPRIVLMVLLSAVVGFLLGAKTAWSCRLLLAALAGVGATAAGGAVLNNFLEREADAQMERTRCRPLPRGDIEPAHALAFGIILVLIGTVTAAWLVNLLTGFLALLAVFLYVLVYTPLKRVTWLNTTIGAVPGAIPPLCGWAAAVGQLDAEAWVLFGILFMWQHPHFYALAWRFRDDYRQAGFKMLPVVEPSGARTFCHITLFSVLLLAVSSLPTVMGMAGWIYFSGALMMGFALLAAGLWLSASKTTDAARRLFLGSVVYLPILWVLLGLDKAAAR